MRLAPFLAIACAAVAGCAATDHTFVPPPPATPADGARWAQYCTFLGARDLAEVNRFLANQGANGWELVRAGSHPAATYCFRMRVREASEARPRTE